MESWEGLNYYTRNVTKWIEFMNLSTTEWGIGHIPSNVVAIQGSLNDTARDAYPSGTIVIENVGNTDVGDRTAESVVFGVCSAIALSWAAIWLVVSWRDKSWKKPRPGARTIPRSGAHSLGSSDTRVDEHSHLSEDIDGVGGGGVFQDVDFQKRLYEYYPTVESHPEVLEKREGTELEADEVAGVSELLVKMFRNDQLLRDLQSAQRMGVDEMEELRGRSEAMLEEVHRRVNTWSARGLEGGEREELKGVVTALARHRVPRYRHREGWEGSGEV